MQVRETWTVRQKSKYEFWEDKVGYRERQGVVKRLYGEPLPTFCGYHDLNQQGLGGGKKKLRGEVAHQNSI